MIYAIEWLVGWLVAMNGMEWNAKRSDCVIVNTRVHFATVDAAAAAAAATAATAA